MACNLTKIATVNLRDLEAALDLIGEMAMPVPTNHAVDYFDELTQTLGLTHLSIREIVLNAFEAGWKEHEQWESEVSEQTVNNWRAISGI